MIVRRNLAPHPRMAWIYYGGQDQQIHAMRG